MEIKTEFVGITRKLVTCTKLPPEYDDNIIRVISKIVDGPTGMIGVFVETEITVEEFFDRIPFEVLRNLNGLLAQKGD